MRIGIDLGGTKIEGIAIADDGERARCGGGSRRRAATTPARSPPSSGLVREIERELASAGTVGVGIPGTISPATGLVKNANSTWLNGQPLAR